MDTGACLDQEDMAGGIIDKFKSSRSLLTFLVSRLVCFIWQQTRENVKTQVTGIS